MFNKKIFTLCSLLLTFALTACGDLTRSIRGGDDWGTEFAAPRAISMPTVITQPFYTPEPPRIEPAYCPEYEYCPIYAPEAAPIVHRDTKRVSVLLPMTGTHAAIGIGIKNAIQIAYLQKQPAHINISFHDLSGPIERRESTISHALGTNPNMIIGPVFNEDVAMLRRMKPREIPAITFTSDTTVLGDGVFTMGLIPAQSVESIIMHAGRNNMGRIAILAPDTPVGRMLAAVALESAGFANVHVDSLTYYTEGDMNNLREVARRVALHQPRSAASIRAREILSDALIQDFQPITNIQRAEITQQLEDLNRTDTVGELPYDAIVFLGGAQNSASLASFLRYYEVPMRSVRFLGTAMWDAESLWRDNIMRGAEFAALPPVSAEFINIYQGIFNVTPARLHSMGYDAAMLSISALSYSRGVAAFLMNPSGFVGLDGVIRMRPNGTNERALQIMRIGGARPSVRVHAVNNFITPIYQTRGGVRNVRAFDSDAGFNAMDFVELPPFVAMGYTSPTFHLTGAIERLPEIPEEIEIDEEIEVVEATDWTPVTTDAVSVQLVDESTVIIRQ